MGGRLYVGNKMDGRALVVNEARPGAEGGSGRGGNFGGDGGDYSGGKRREPRS